MDKESSATICVCERLCVRRYLHVCMFPRIYFLVEQEKNKLCVHTWAVAWGWFVGYWSWSLQYSHHWCSYLRPPPQSTLNLNKVINLLSWMFWCPAWGLNRRRPNSKSSVKLSRMRAESQWQLHLSLCPLWWKLPLVWGWIKKQIEAHIGANWTLLILSSYL